MYKIKYNITIFQTLWRTFIRISFIYLYTIFFESLTIHNSDLQNWIFILYYLNSLLLRSERNIV